MKNLMPTGRPASAATSSGMFRPVWEVWIISDNAAWRDWVVRRVRRLGGEWRVFGAKDRGTRVESLPDLIIADIAAACHLPSFATPCLWLSGHSEGGCARDAGLIDLRLGRLCAERRC